MNPYLLTIERKKLSDTQLAIHKAFLKAYGQSQKVSVRQICLETPIARSTFYTYYRDLEELKREIEEVTIAKLLAHTSSYQENHQIQTGFMAQLLDFIAQEQLVFDSFLLEHPNQDFITLWKAAIKSNFYPLFEEKKKDSDLLLEVFASSVVASVIYYLSQADKSLDMDQLEAVVLKILS